MNHRIYPSRQSCAIINTIVTVVAFMLFGAAAWYSVTSTLEEQQAYHCQQGWQPACK